MNMEEYTDLDWAIIDRQSMGLPPVGPLTRDQQRSEDAYLAHCEEMDREMQATDAAGGRTICDQCDKRSMRWQTVCTLGYPGHPGAEFSEYGRCENCGHEVL